MKILVPLMTVALAAGATQPVNESPHAELTQSGSPMVESFLSEEVEDINAMIDKASDAGEEWVLDPVRIAMNVVEQGPDAIEERRHLSLTFEGHGERPRSCTVTLVTDGYLDDSMRGEWCRFTMDRTDEGLWHVTGFRHAWRCYRGHVSESGQTHTDHLDRFTSDRCL